MERNKAVHTTMGIGFEKVIYEVGMRDHMKQKKKITSRPTSPVMKSRSPSPSHRFAKNNYNKDHDSEEEIKPKSVYQTMSPEQKKEFKAK
mgnify:CR=1 FL=1